MPDSTSSRYQTVETLGEGGEGTVVLARDLQRSGSPVALKKTVIDEKNAAAARSSAYRLYAIGHPNLCRVHDFCIEDGTACWVMEYVQGEEITVHVRGIRKSGRKIEIVQTLMAVLSGLGALHEHALVHGDIKSSNVLVTREGIPKIIDFGTDPSAGSETAGTAGFSAPEVLRGEGVHPQSDVYSFAAMAFECLTQKPAFSGKSAGERAQKQIESGGFVPPPGMDRAMAGYFTACLDPDMEKRPPTAAAALDMLSRITGISPWKAVVDRGGLCRPCFTGREKDLAPVKSALLSPSTAEHAAWMIGGGAFCGKTRCLEETMARALGLGWRVAGTPGERFDTRGVFNQLLSFVDEDRIPEQVSEQMKSFSRRPEEKDAGAIEPGMEAARQAGVLWHLLRMAAERAPVMLLIDDLGESSEHAREVAFNLMRSVRHYDGAERCICLVAAGSKDAAVRAQKNVEDLALISIENLDPAGTQRLISSMCPGIPVERAFTDALHAASGGNPGISEEIFRLSFAEAGEQGPDSRIRTTTVEEAVLERTRDLASTARDVIRLLALDPDGVPQTAVVELLPQPDTSSVIDEIVTSGLAREYHRSGITMLRLMCPSVHEAILEQADVRGEGLKKLHLRLYESLKDKKVPASSRALHLAKGGRQTRAADEYFTAGTEAALNAELDISAEFYERAIALGKGRWKKRTQAIEALVNVLRRMGKSAEAELFLEKSLRKSEKTQAVFSVLRAELLADMGNYEEAMQWVGQALESGGSPARLYLAQAWAAFISSRYEDSLKATRKGLKRNAGKYKSDLLNLLGLNLHYLEKPEEALKAFSRARQGYTEAGDSRGLIKVAGMTGLVRQAQGDWEGAMAGYDEALNIARRTGDLPREGLYLNNASSVAHILGDYAGALEGYRRSERIALRLGNRNSRYRALLNIASLMCEMGAFDEASKTAMDAYGGFSTLGQGALAARALLVSTEAMTASTESGVEEAVKRFDEVEKALSEAGDNAGVLEAGVAKAHFLSRRDPERAEALASRIAEKAQKDGKERLAGRALVVQASSLLASTDGPVPEACELLRTAVESSDRARDPETLWQAQYYLSVALRRGGFSAEADESLNSAVRRLDILADQVPAGYRERYLSRSVVSAMQHQLGRRDDTLPRASAGTGDGQLRRRIKDLETLLEINQELVREHDTQRLLGLIMERAVELTGAERGYVLLPEGDTLRIAIASGVEKGDEDVAAFSTSVAEQVIATGRSLLALDALEDDRFNRFLSVHSLKLRSILCVPMRIRRRIEGVLYLDSRLRARAFTREDEELLEAFGVQAALAMGTARLIEADRKRADELEASRKEVEALSRQLAGDLEKTEAELDEAQALLRQTQADISKRMRKAGIVGASGKMQRLFGVVERVAGTDVPVFIYGASGTGKELVAKAIHAQGARSDMPFVSVNCGALPSTLLASELFGHVKGAFTGAGRDKAGLFATADGGTLFLDEVADMDPEMQTQLLRVLQDGCFWPVGSDREKTSDVRIISASNRDLDELVAAGEYREDLYYRINVIRMDVPPLKERVDDIPLLVKHFLNKYSDKKCTIESQAMKCMCAYAWPGNVRELENEIQRAITFSDTIIREADLSTQIREAGAGIEADEGGDKARDAPLRELVRDYEKRVLLRVLRELDGNAAAAARRLGMSRTALYKKLGKYGLMDRLKSARS